MLWFARLWEIILQAITEWTEGTERIEKHSSKWGGLVGRGPPRKQFCRPYIDRWKESLLPGVLEDKSRYGRVGGKRSERGRRELSWGWVLLDK